MDRSDKNRRYIVLIIYISLILLISCTQSPTLHKDYSPHVINDSVEKSSGLDKLNTEALQHMMDGQLYLDQGETVPVSHRVVPFFNKVAYLIDPKKKPLFWAKDITFGRHAGGKEIPLKPVFIAPGHPLADYAGLLAPADRFLGMYTGRDGPPGYNYYAPPAYISLVNFAAMGYWQSGDRELLQKITPFIADLRNTDWRAIVQVMRGHLAEAILNHPVQHSRQALGPEMLPLN